MRRLIETYPEDDEGPFPAPGSWLARSFFQRYPMATEIVMFENYEKRRYEVWAVFPFVLPIRGCA